MKISVMQPYFFPYIGYFQLVKAVDRFIFYDDVNFLKKGWINRNRILVNKAPHTFSVPLKKISQNNLIKDSFISMDVYSSWKGKFLETISYAYKKAPFYNQGIDLIKYVLSNEYEDIANLACESVMKVSKYLQITTEFGKSSQLYENMHLSRQDRLIDICKIEGASIYINAIGGQELYSTDAFLQEGIILQFIESNKISYSQFGNAFIPGLSIIDTIMFNSVNDIIKKIDEYRLI